MSVCMAWLWSSCLPACVYDAGLGAATLAAHTVVKNVVDYANNIFGTFSTVAQSLVASELGKVIGHCVPCLLTCCISDFSGSAILKFLCIQAAGSFHRVQVCFGKVQVFCKFATFSLVWSACYTAHCRSHCVNHAMCQFHGSTTTHHVSVLTCAVWAYSSAHAQMHSDKIGNEAVSLLHE